MRRLNRPGLAVASVICLLASDLPARQADSTDEQRALHRLLEDLGEDSFEARQAAMKQIWNSPELSPESLQRFASSADPESAARIRRLLALIRMGINPETEPAVARLIFSFHSAGQEEMSSILYQLVQRGHHELVMSLIQSVEDRYTREYLAEYVLNDEASPIDSLLGSDPVISDPAILERTDRVMQHPYMWKWHLSDCLLYWSLRGGIDDRIAERAGAVGESGTPAQVMALIEMLRFQRKYDEALDRIGQWQAEDRLRRPLRVRVLAEADRWAELAREYDQPAADSRSLSRVCQAALLHQWSGNPQQAAVWRERLVADGRVDSWNALATVQLARLDAASIRAAAPHMSTGVAFELLCRIGSHEEAFGISGAPRAEAEQVVWFERELSDLTRQLRQSRRAHDDEVHRRTNDRFLLLLNFAGYTGELGRRDLAIRYFELLAAALHDDEAGYHALFWRTLAFDRLTRFEVGEDLWHFFDVLGVEDEPERTLEILFPDTPDEAAMWMEILTPGIPDTRERVQLVTGLLRSPFAEHQDSPDMESLVSLARKFIDRYPPAQRGYYLLLLARTCRLHDRDLLARDLELESGFAGEAAAFVQMAERSATENDWGEAARWSSRSREIDPANNEHRYRLACYRRLAGANRESEALFFRAGLHDLHSWALLDHAALVQACGLTDQAADMIDLYLRGVTSDQLDLYWEHRRLAELLDSRDPVAALNQWRRAQLAWTRHVDLTVNNIARTRLYATRAAEAEARVHLAGGRTDEAGELLLRCLEVSSPGTRLVEEFVPRLEAAGHQQWADRIFEAAAARYLQVLGTWPDSALHHNNLAWACVRCDRWPQRRLEHARRAVQLSPDHAGYLDTLAEILYRSGQQAEAIRIAEQCVARNPFRQHYRDQLARFRALDPAADR